MSAAERPSPDPMSVRAILDHVDVTVASMKDAMGLLDDTFSDLLGLVTLDDFGRQACNHVHVVFYALRAMMEEAENDVQRAMAIAPRDRA